MNKAATDAAVIDTAVIDAAARRLQAGQLVAFPTETVYGLGADASQQAAVVAIYAAKGRPHDHPLIVHVASWSSVSYWMAIDGSGHEARAAARATLLASAFWPGPITFIVPRRKQAPAWACGGQSSIGLRCPSHPVAHELLLRFEALGGHGVAAPSANRFGRISPTTAAHVRDELAQAAPLILDGGAAEVGLESTIIDLTRAQPVLLRPGAITPEQIAAVLAEPVLLSGNLIDTVAVDRAAPRVPGSLASHYAPVTPLQLVSAGNFEAALRQCQSNGERVLSLRLSSGSEPANAQHYGQQLYARLRELDAQGADRILAEEPPLEPQWAAVRDRLMRARTR